MLCTDDKMSLGYLGLNVIIQKEWIYNYKASDCDMWNKNYQIKQQQVEMRGEREQNLGLDLG